MCVQCAAHMAEPEGAAAAFLMSGSFDKSCLSHASRHERRPRVPFAKRWGTEWARRFEVLLLQRLFFCCKFGKLLTKLFGLNHVRPSNCYRRGGFHEPFVLRSSFPTLQSSSKGFLLHLSRLICTQVQEIGAFPQTCHNSALFPLHSPATASPRGGVGVRGRGTLPKKPWEIQTVCETSSAINKCIHSFKAIPGLIKSPQEPNGGKGTSRPG